MSNVKTEKVNHTAIMTLCRDDAMNALCSSFIEEINEVIDAVESDPDIYTLIITGSGKAFVSGADVNEMVNMTKEEIFAWSALGSSLNLRLEKLPIPVIAAINGYAMGGGLELAMSCDIRIAARGIKMGLPEVGLGVICGAGGTQRLPRIVGAGIAKEIIFTGRILDADEALKIGLVNQVVDAEKLIDSALFIAETINSKGQLAIRAAKEAVNFAGESSIEDGCLFERKKFSLLFETEDQKIGMCGFLNKEKNVIFKNK